MSYRFIEDIAIADVAFEAWGEDLAGVLTAAAEATLNVMVSDLDSVALRNRRTVNLEAEEPDLLLFDFLQEVIFFKDANRLLLRPVNVVAEAREGVFKVSADLVGEELDMERHDLVVDVKAVTLHRFVVERVDGRWRAFVVLDI
ncbi:MAG: archease [Gemmatimonadetes bacterium]|nr:archease [Gemmatimonadota bacterium]MDE3259012.1 archease [Gemmatimonadota bacterium]